ncbi:Rrp15p-domain-containing protein [Auriculariales sp. MPI-PUGE-AT-0066]|nr:Rrp15p-domain-containing protein [Auriculariales sp. MPI-PUGE-AT-0066]
MPPAKRLKRDADQFSDLDNVNHDGSIPEAVTADADDASGSGSGSGSGYGSDSAAEPDTDDEIAALQSGKSKQTAKRKRRAVSPSRFGSQLQVLLGTHVPTEQPLALKPDVATRRADEKRQGRDRRDADVKRKEKEEKNRLTDVIGGWGGENERALRKIAQRGVVKLFNAIQQAQDAQIAASGGKVARPDPGAKDKRKGKDNLLGRGRDPAASLDKDSFLDLIKSGGVVSKR